MSSMEYPSPETKRPRAELSLIAGTHYDELKLAEFFVTEIETRGEVNFAVRSVADRDALLQARARVRAIGNAGTYDMLSNEPATRAVPFQSNDAPYQGQMAA